MLETVAWAVMFMCLGAVIVIGVFVVVLMISSDQ
jgi:hypothetical protein